MKTIIFILFGFFAPFALTQQIATQEDFATVEQWQSYQSLIKIVRCPTCQNQDIAESNAPLAQQLRALIIMQIKEGKSENEIVDYLIERYGDFITYNPPLKTKTYILWLSPLLLMLIALLYFILFKKKPVKSKLNSEEEAQLQQWIKQYGNRP